MTQEDTSTNLNSIFIKCRFKSSLLSFYGLIIMMYESNKKITMHNTVVSSFSDLFNTSPNTEWDEFENQINQVKWSGKYNNPITKDITITIEGLINNPSHNLQFYKIANNYDFAGCENFIYDLLHRIIQDKNLVIEVGLQEVSPEDIENTKAKRDLDIKKKYGDVKQTKNFSVEDGATTIQTSLILSPAKGTLITDLKIGDKIMLKIDPVSDKANYYINIYKLQEEGVIRPIPAEVVDIKAISSSEPIEIIARIDKGVYGKSIEEEWQVKVRMYDPRYDYKPDSQKTAAPSSSTTIESESTGLGNFTFVLFGIAGLLLILLVSIIYLLF